MNKKIALFVVYIVLFNIVLCRISFADTVMNFPVTEDANTQKGANESGKNFGSDSRVFIKNNSNGDTERNGYIKVDFAGLQSVSLNSALLYFYVMSGGNPVANMPITIATFEDDNWNENVITFNNPPNISTLTTSGNPVVKLNSPVWEGWYSADVTALVNGQMKDKIISFKLTPQNMGGTVIIASSESTDKSQRPYLSIVSSYDGPSFTFKNSIQAPATGLLEAVGGKAIATAKNTISSAVILALYDHNGTMKDIASEYKDINGSQEIELGATINLPGNLDGYYVRGYIWDSLTKLKPYGASQSSGSEPFSQSGELLSNLTASVDGNVVTISGKLYNIKFPTQVSLLVTNPQKTIIDVNTDIKSTVNHLEQVITDGNGYYVFRYTIDELAKSGTYNVYVRGANDTEIDNISFTYFDPYASAKAIEDINNATNSSDIELALSKYAELLLVEKNLFESLVNPELIYNSLIMNTFTSIEEFIVAFNELVVICAINEAESTTDIKEIIINYNDTLKLDMDNYNQIINVNPVFEMLKAVVPFDDVTDLNEKFQLFVTEQIQSETIRFAFDEDAFVRGGAYADQIFSNSSTLTIKNGGGTADITRYAYMKADLTSLRTGSISKATLNFYAYSTDAISPATLDIFGLQNDDWSENTIKWNLRPSDSEKINLGLKAQISSFIEAPTKYSVDITNYVNQQMNNKVISFVISDSLVSGGAQILSMENQDLSKRPYIEISSGDNAPIFTYKNSSGSLVSKLSEAGGGSILVEAQNTMSAVLILALYNQSGALVDFSFNKKDVDNGIQTSFVAELKDLPSTLSSYYACAYFWSDFQKIFGYGDKAISPGTIEYPQTASVDNDIMVKVQGESVTISGVAKGLKNVKPVTLEVINPQKDLDPENPKLSIAHLYQTKTDSSGKYSFRFDMSNNSHSGIFKANITHYGLENPVSILFNYNNIVKQAQAVKAVNDAKTKEELIKTFSDYDGELHIKSDIIHKIEDINLVYDMILANPVFSNCEEILQAYKGAVITVGINEEDNFENLISLLNDKKSDLGLNDDKRYQSFLSSKFIDVERSLVYNEIFSKRPFTTTKDLIDEIYTRICVSSFNKLISWGETSELLTLNSTILNIDLSIYNSLSNKKTVDTNMVNVNHFVDANDIKVKFNSFVEAQYYLENLSKNEHQGGSTSDKSTIKVNGDVVPAVVAEIALKEERYNSPFKDMQGYEWAENYIAKLYNKGIVEGHNGNFYPSAAVTREQFIKMLVSAFNLLDESTRSDFNDVNEKEWYYKYIASAQAKGITEGKGDGSFGLGEEISRQDMSVMAYRAAKLANVHFQSNKLEVEFNDGDEIDNYAKQAITIMQKASIVEGFDDNNFLPKEQATRVQAATVICKFVNLKEVQ